MRCFVAIDLPRPVRNHLANVTTPLRERFDVKWVRPEAMHLTLLFAGDIDEAAADGLAEAVRSVALPATPMLSLQRFGCFPPKGVPRVLWVGLDGDVAAVVALHDALAEATAPLGLAADRRGFTPHVTVGRLRSAFGAMALRDQAAALDDQLKPKPFAAEALTLYHSELTPNGPRYEPLVERAFAPAPG